MRLSKRLRSLCRKIPQIEEKRATDAQIKTGGQVGTGGVVPIEGVAKTEDPAGDQFKSIACKEFSKQLLLFTTC
jgi:hypothetical protein